MDEQEHQDFRLQNDREWRAKLDHLKAELVTARMRAAALESEIEQMRQAREKADG